MREFFLDRETKENPRTGVQEHILHTHSAKTRVVRLFVCSFSLCKQTNKQKRPEGPKRGLGQLLIASSLRSLWSLRSPWSQKKVFTRYVIVENNNIYISDIIISIIYTTLITHGSEIRRGRKIVCLFVYIGKTNKQTTNFHPSPRGGVRYRCFITK